MLLLNEALDDLGKLEIRSEVLNADFHLPPEEARACVDIFAHVCNSMVVPDIFSEYFIDIKLLRALPDIIESPYVNIDHGMRVMYYNALYYGLQEIKGPGDPMTTKAYAKVLESIPAWLEAPNETDMDGHTAALTAWTAINNHDYQLSWKFHCKSCQFIKLKGIDQLDANPASSLDEESRRNGYRYLHLHVVSTDTLFRLFYGKPTVIRWSPNKIRPPHTFLASNMHPSASQVIMSVVWVRYTYLTVELLNFIDQDAPMHKENSLHDKIDDFCHQLEDLIVEWKLEDLMIDETSSHEYRCLVADHVST
jgi:hypothetical protein